MAPALSLAQVRDVLALLQASAVRVECHTCRCFVCLLEQLRREAPAEAVPLIDALGGASAGIHECLGCEPCPPGDVYVAHVGGVEPAP